MPRRGDLETPPFRRERRTQPGAAGAVGLNGSLAGLEQPSGYSSRELVTNSVKHAGAGPEDSIDLELTASEEMVRVEVRDGGPGFEPPTRATEPGGFGLCSWSISSPTAGASRASPGPASGSRSTGGPPVPPSLCADRPQGTTIVKPTAFAVGPLVRTAIEPDGASRTRAVDADECRAELARGEVEVDRHNGRCGGGIDPGGRREAEEVVRRAGGRQVARAVGHDRAARQHGGVGPSPAGSAGCTWSARRAVSARGAVSSLGARRTGRASRAVGAVGSVRSIGSVGSVCSVCAWNPIHTRRTGRAGRAAGSAVPIRSRRTVESLRAAWSLSAGRTGLAGEVERAVRVSQRLGRLAVRPLGETQRPQRQL